MAYKTLTKAIMIARMNMPGGRINGAIVFFSTNMAFSFTVLQFRGQQW